jgi:hypothetical protein
VGVRKGRQAVGQRLDQRPADERADALAGRGDRLRDQRIGLIRGDAVQRLHEASQVLVQPSRAATLRFLG